MYQVSLGGHIALGLCSTANVLNLKTQSVAHDQAGGLLVCWRAPLQLRLNSIPPTARSRRSTCSLSPAVQLGRWGGGDKSCASSVSICASRPRLSSRSSTGSSTCSSSSATLRHLGAAKGHTHSRLEPATISRLERKNKDTGPIGWNNKQAGRAGKRSPASSHRLMMIKIICILKDLLVLVVADLPSCCSCGRENTTGKAPS